MSAIIEVGTQVMFVLIGAVVCIIGGYALFRVMNWHAEQQAEHAERRADHRADDRLRDATRLLDEVQRTVINSQRFDREVRT
jgi:hypothetical protein